jgi:NAD(P)-dependent dehydrogenase (short-subunit alcohol dehydrogenase family)
VSASSSKVALVTGSDGGLGAAIVRRLEHDGWLVAASTHHDGHYAGDVSDPRACNRIVDRVLEDLGRLDLLVNNAAYMALSPVSEHEIADWWRVIDVNLSGSFYLVRRAAGALREARGSIVNISSRMGVAGGADGTAYAASKAGLIGLTKAVSLELAPDVRVNAIAPGPIDTPQLLVDARRNRWSLDDERADAVLKTPLQRLVSADEVAGTVAFLVSPDAAHYSGQVLSPNGGLLM